MTVPPDPPAPVGASVSITGLARAAGDAGAPVPGHRWTAARLETRVGWRLATARWLLALDGAVIVDLPFGDFRVLECGDALDLPAGIHVSLQPVKEAVTLLWHDAGA